MRIEDIEKQYGKRPRIPMGHGEPLQEHHFKGILNDGRKFVYCPIGFICSWLEGDYDNEYCPWCKKYFHELN